ncbi:hypothetical protein K0T92_01010 [Paenibacillus oenotherae]|uniref:Hook-length control protein FliK n=1 Tax=Paenibacillus oenotherae TaxID=1435645 RepID=A0ABS7D299_9BACL|nr:hypothetical protein [Paenibacillus oenotherae]MBW7473318.1 hypothetical protein [Paenibacillus oenotherae]
MAGVVIASYQRSYLLFAGFCRFTSAAVTPIMIVEAVEMPSWTEGERLFVNIGQLMGGLLGDVQPLDSKALELKVGQIVRGVFVQMMDNQEALVQINGIQVRAKLETPLQPGQSTLLQVQPQSTAGTLVLKTVEGQAALMPEESLKDLAKALGLPEQKWALDLVSDLRRDGMTALTRETARQFQGAAAAMPQGEDPQTWMQAASLAHKRGLPMTGATVGALHQALYGAPAHALLEALEQGLAAWSGSSAGAGAEKAAPQPTAAQAAAAKLQALLAEGAALMRAAAGGAQPPAAAGGAAPGGAVPAAGGEAAAGMPGAPRPDAGAAGNAAAPAAPAAAGAGTAGGAAAGSAAQPAQAAAASGAASASAAQSSAAAAGASGSPQAAVGSSSPQTAAAATSGGPQAAQQSSASNWLGQLIKWLGVDHERGLAASTIGHAQHAGEPLEGSHNGLAEQPAGKQPAARSLDGQPPILQQEKGVVGPQGERTGHIAGTASLPPVTPEGVSQDAAKPTSADSLKSVLMTLASGDDVPPALRDTAQQLVQQITGQQLLLSQERTGSPFTHLTMFIPLQGSEHGQTASVHIQTRRGRKGELDAHNCRLLFDLRMKSLGDTVVDVHVVDKIVSLNLWNDHPAIGTLLESSRGEVTEALNRAGYQLLTLRSTPMPNRTPDPADAREPKSSLQTPAAAEWSSKPYKGVDFRA